jgi:hypothetical protein
MRGFVAVDMHLHYMNFEASKVCKIANNAFENMYISKWNKHFHSSQSVLI